MFFILMLVAMSLTLISLAAGLVLMGKGGQANKNFGNKLMQMRVYLQGATILFFALALLTSA